MKAKEILTIVLMLFIAMLNLQGQQSNNFEDEYDMPILIDTANQSNVWQIGMPSKSVFSESFSDPNALLTDTLNSYPTNNKSSFYFKINMETLWSDYPYFILTWSQKMDCEIGKDGGVIDVSYDSMQTWVNIFEDMLYQPTIIGNLNSDKLFNGTLGITESDPIWKDVGFCWTNANGIPVDEIFVRFTFYSDTIDTFQEGWMLDDFETSPTFLDNVEELISKEKNELILEIYPNPSANQITLKRKSKNLHKAIVHIIDMSGNIVYQRTSSYSDEVRMDISHLQTGTYFVVLRNERGEILGTNRILKISVNKD